MVTTEHEPQTSAPAAPEPVTEKSSGAQRRNASLKFPTIAAIVEGGYRFANEAQAINQLRTLREFFTVSRQQQEGLTEGQLLLWIKSYALTPEEKKEGYTGNFAMIGVVKRKDGKFGLEAKKVESELKFHPERRRPRHKHPNWGHPILRAIQKGKQFKAVEEAQAELVRLHEEFPEVTIPLNTKLYLIIYSRKERPPVQKFVLEIKALPEGGFVIDPQRNDYQQVMPVKDPPKDAPEGVLAKDKPKGENLGRFTSMVELHRQRKRKKPQN